MAQVDGTTYTVWQEETAGIGFEISMTGPSVLRRQRAWRSDGTG
jgi:hypothetical protein